MKIKALCRLFTALYATLALALVCANADLAKAGIEHISDYSWEYDEDYLYLNIRITDDLEFGFDQDDSESSESTSESKNHLFCSLNCYWLDKTINLGEDNEQSSYAMHLSITVTNNLQDNECICELFGIESFLDQNTPNGCLRKAILFDLTTKIEKVTIAPEEGLQLLFDPLDSRKVCLVFKRLQV